MAQLTFQQAVERVTLEKRWAFAFCPFTDESTPRTNVHSAGANIFVLVHGPDHALRPNQRPEYRVHYVGGRYGTRGLAREEYSPRNVPLEAREANYRLLQRFDEAALYNELKIIHCELQRWAEPL